MDYSEFLAQKIASKKPIGFKPLWMPDFLYDFQRHLCDWTIRIGRGGNFQDCGLGKTPQEFIVAENIVRKTNRPVLLLTPIAVGAQMVREAEKFGVKVKRTREGKVYKSCINITNYQRLHYYNPSDFAAVVLDESSCIKHSDSATKKNVTKFMSKVQYKFLYTATPAPNDFMELGSSSEALGIMTRNSMLGMFFTNDGDTTQQWTLKRTCETAILAMGWDVGKSNSETGRSWV